MNVLRETILIVDDTPEIRVAIRDILATRNYGIHLVVNGAEALAYARSEQPGLIMLGSRLPDVSGYEVCARLKSDDSTRWIPVIFISGSPAALDKKKLFAIGGMDYIVPPFEPEEILLRVKTQLALSGFQHGREDWEGGTGPKGIRRNREPSEPTQPFQSPRMDALAAFGRGMAHELNNAFSIVFGYTTLAMGHLDMADRLKKDLERLQDGALKAKKHLDHVLSFFQKSKCEMQLLNMSLIVDEALALVAPSVPSSIEVRRHLSSRKRVLANPDQLRQVIINLCSNACQAMADTGGILTVSLTDQGITADDVPPGLTLSPGRYLLLMIGDTGHGMDEKIRERIFEPYFTTRKKSRNKGLGLTFVYGILKKIDGHVSVFSRRGMGTNFQVYLPAVEKEIILPEKKPRPERQVRGSERIMFVDDEETIVKLVTRSLPRYGYDVVAYSDGAAALKEFERAPDRYDLVISDKNMPVMDGLAFLRKIEAIKPGIPVVLCSGDVDCQKDGEYKNLNIEFYQKPVIIDDLCGMVRKILTK